MSSNKKKTFPVHGAYLITFSLFMLLSCSDSMKIACVGDSITFGYGLEKPNTNAYPAVLNDKLGRAYKVRNFGHSGATALKKSDLPYWHVPEFKNLKTYQPDIIVLILGTNDAKDYNWPGKTIFLQDYKAMILELNSMDSKPQIYLGTPPPVFGNVDIISNDTIVNEIVPAIKKIASDLHLQVIDFYSAFQDKPQLFPDDIHPNKVGTSEMAEIVYTKLIEEQVIKD